MQSWEASNLRIYSNRNSSVRSNITPPLSDDEVVSPKPTNFVETNTTPPCSDDEVVSPKPTNFVETNTTPPCSDDEVVSPKPTKFVETNTTPSCSDDEVVSPKTTFEATKNPPCYNDVVSQKPAIREVDDLKRFIAKLETKNDRLNGEMSCLKSQIEILKIAKSKSEKILDEKQDILREAASLKNYNDFLETENENLKVSD